MHDDARLKREHLESRTDRAFGAVLEVAIDEERGQRLAVFQGAGCVRLPCGNSDVQAVAVTTESRSAPVQYVRDRVPREERSMDGPAVFFRDRNGPDLDQALAAVEQGRQKRAGLRRHWLRHGYATPFRFRPASVRRCWCGGIGRSRMVFILLFPFGSAPRAAGTARGVRGFGHHPEPAHGRPSSYLGLPRNTRPDHAGRRGRWPRSIGAGVVGSAELRR